MGKTAPPESYEGRRVVTAAEMAEIDRRAIEEHDISADTLMENAGTATADAVLAAAGAAGLGEAPNFVILCGKGNNGGDGLVAARILHDRDIPVKVFVLRPSKGGAFKVEVAANLMRAEKSGVSVRFIEKEPEGLSEALAEADLVIDALLGTGSSGKPSGALKKTIQALTKSGKPVASIDVPSGLHPDTGYHSGVFVKAKWTFTLGLPKRGLVVAHAVPNVGELKVLDIGFPEEVLK